MKEDEPGFLASMKSVLAAFFGVQSNRNRERDFTRGRFHHFVIAGLLGTALFITVIAGLVWLVLRMVPA
ncbi:MAG: DUF2970 domain-containing protein [Gammaproteobacteria bacterium]|nr:MAG: DUF2970 domain-containing protein [Gammaproteobacteria bacterium]